MRMLKARGLSNKQFLQDDSGQVLVEYVLMLTVAILVVATIASVLRRSLFEIWKVLKNEIAAACPGCPPPA